MLTAAAPRRMSNARDADVLVLGAGLAGLSAALVIEAAGLTVQVIEGERRIGGRLHTLDDLPGHPEAGGVQVGAGYAIFRRLAAAHGVALVAEKDLGLARSLLRIGQSSIAPADWAQSAANHLRADERAVLPPMLLWHYAAKLPKLAGPAAWTQAPASYDIALSTALTAAGASAEALRLIAANLNGNSLAGMSQVHLLRTLALLGGPPGHIDDVVGGSQRFPEALARALRGPVRLGQPVSAIRETAAGVEVVAGGKVLRARAAICTFPFAALRTIALDAPLPEALTSTIAHLPYTHASFAYLSARTPFWREDGLPPSLWSDERQLGRVFVLGDDPAMLKVWTTGAGADALDRMDDAAAGRWLIGRIEAARPAARGRLTLLKRVSWQKSAFARGIYHHIGTGQAGRLAQSVAFIGRRLHFAGEHLALASPGMEAALESGECAARAVLGSV